MPLTSAASAQPAELVAMVRGVVAVEDRLYVTTYFDGSIYIIDV